jgi:MFS family permease
MDFVCENKDIVGSMLLCYGLCAGIFGVFLFPVPERWGRVKSMRIFGGVNVLAQFLVILVPNYYTRIIGYCMLGVSQLKNGISYVWMFENVENRLKSTACGVMNGVDAGTLGVMCIYFMYYPNYKYLQIIMSTLCAISYIILISVMPESAKWHLIKGNMEGALESFDTIAKLNGSKCRIPRDSTFAEFIPADTAE